MIDYLTPDDFLYTEDDYEDYADIVEECDVMEGRDFDTWYENHYGEGEYETAEFRSIMDADHEIEFARWLRDKSDEIDKAEETEKPDDDVDQL